MEIVMPLGLALLGLSLGVLPIWAPSRDRDVPDRAPCWIDDQDVAALGSVTDQWLKEHIR